MTMLLDKLQRLQQKYINMGFPEDEAFTLASKELEEEPTPLESANFSITTLIEGVEE